eukprot:CAMPEP_0202691858 /NCGR_PEP_ID=MMETSP1385-20130828/6440_1 /ASSEMBLY_ACC=CAM_ASM_000861 /TAXON_ID=933848 /ORGANISM="Elphidium margaritaceum" /LENGTH=324 /DNA_ID=CAMNT_0049347315 /DNA_START=44 /DNA_END=1018 /DNA_ORIENTATION=+
MAQTAQWQFRSARVHQPQNAQSSVCRGNVFDKNDAFKPRPKIGRTPLVTNCNSNGAVRSSPSFIAQSPFISPATYNFMHSPLTEVTEEEPGSGIKRRRRRRSSTSSQPEGVYSPIPQSKILQELMDVDNSNPSNQQKHHAHACAAQSPINVVGKAQNVARRRSAAECDIKDTEDDDDDSRCAHAKSNDIRSEVLAMINTMDDEITKEIDERYKLLRFDHRSDSGSGRGSVPASMSTPFLLSRQMSALNIRTPVPSLSMLPPPPAAALNIERNICRNSKRSWTCRAALSGAEVTDMLAHILNVIGVLLLLVVYWTIVDVQWKKKY